jgi:hypothetical protein
LTGAGLAIVDTRRVHDCDKQVTHGIDDNMALATLDQLAAVEPGFDP